MWAGRREKGDRESEREREKGRRRRRMRENVCVYSESSVEIHRQRN